MYKHSDGKMSSTDSGAQTVSAKGNQASTSAGTFTLRRAHYFSESGMPSSNAEHGQNPQTLSLEPISSNKFKD